MTVGLGELGKYETFAIVASNFQTHAIRPAQMGFAAVPDALYVSFAIKLTNTSASPQEFHWSWLTIVDDSGRPLSNVTRSVDLVRRTVWPPYESQQATVFVQLPKGRSALAILFGPRTGGNRLRIALQ